MLGVIKRAVILGLAATAQGQQANQNCKVTKDVCFELAPKPTSCTTNELAIGCKELFAHCGPVCNLHLSESIECQLYGDVKKGNGNTIYSLSKKINFITSSALEKLIKSPSKEEMLSIIDQTTTTLDRLKAMIKSSKSIKDAHQSSDHPLTTHDYLAPDDHLEKYYGKGGILESELFDQINDLKENLHH